MTAIRKPDGPLVRFLLDPEAALRALVGWLAHVLPILLLVLGLVAAALASWRLWTVRRDRRLMEDARRVRVLSPMEIEPAGARTLWMGLHALLRPWWRRLFWGQPYLAWEIVATSEDVEVSIRVPKVVPDGLVQRVVEASWPGARTQTGEGDALARLGLQRTVETTDLALAEPEWFPIGTTPGTDPLTLGMAALAGLGEGETAAIQVLAQPLTSVSRRRFRRAARNVRAGAAPSARLARSRSRYRVPPDPSVEGDVRAILAKASSPAYRCLIRLAVASPSRESARGRLHGLAGAFATGTAFTGGRGRCFPAGSLAPTCCRCPSSRRSHRSPPRAPCPASSGRERERWHRPGFCRSPARSWARPTTRASSGPSRSRSLTPATTST